MASLLWLQGGACSGNTMSFLNAEEPSACDLVTDFGIDVLWHPSLGMDMGDNVQRMLREIASGDHGLTFGDGVPVELKGLDGLHTVYEVVDAT